MNSTTIEIIGAVASILTCIQFLPQVFHAMKSDDLSAISSPTYSIISGNTILWMGYGLSKGDTWIFIANLVCFLAAVTILSRKHMKSSGE